MKVEDWKLEILDECSNAQERKVMDAMEKFQKFLEMNIFFARIDVWSVR